MKMTNEEAINELKNRYLRISAFAYKEQCNKANEALDIAIQAVEKQIPKKITHEATIYKCCTCPNCKNVVDEYTEFLGKKVRVTYAYCHYCGQKLDWSDNDEN